LSGWQHLAHLSKYFAILFFFFSKSGAERISVLVLKTPQKYFRMPKKRVREYISRGEVRYFVKLEFHEQVVNLRLSGVVRCAEI
jgi:hypothetical protein